MCCYEASATLALTAMAANNDNEALTPAQVARRLNVAVSTVRRWAVAERIKSFRTPGGQLRFRRVDIDAIDTDDFEDDAAAS